MNHALRRIVLACALIGMTGAPSPAQTFSDTGPDAEDYGAKEGYRLGGPGTFRNPKYLVGRLSHNEDIARTRRIARGERVWEFKRAAPPVEIEYQFRGQKRSLAGYLAHHPTTGLLVLKDDTILFEHYQYARSDRDRFLSQSMAKTVTSMLIGLAVEEGRIKSIDDPVATYVPALQGREYGSTPIRALLHMASGVEFSEDYGGSDDISTLSRGLMNVARGAQAPVVGQFNKRIAPPDTRFSYASVETEILGLVLAAVLDRPIADYLSDKIWRPVGMESDASWGLDAGGQEMTYCCINAVLRDYARLGRLLAHDGAWDGTPVIPRQWILDATTAPADKPFLAPRPDRYGYGYQVWLVSSLRGEPERRMFALLGIHGQTVFVDPQSKLVMAQTSVRKKPSNDPVAAETSALWRALVARFGTSP
ncbi:MAG: serine hydrolase [Alphaproteobacteria bacterium]|nr:serine hydrolase [Alphaproteobacteria bacterium]